MDISSSLQILLQDAGYRTWLTSGEYRTSVCFEDEAVLGFATVFGNAQSILEDWQVIETSLLARHAPNLRSASEKAWNVYSIFLGESPPSESEQRQIQQIEENLERTRKIAACGISSVDDISKAILPVLPIQYKARLADDDLAARLKRRISTLLPAGADAVLDERVTPSQVVALLRGST